MRLSDALLMAGDEAGFDIADVLVGASTHSFTGSSSASIPLNALTGGLASAPSEGDLVIVAVALEMTSTTPVTSLPSGWTNRKQSYQTGTPNRIEMRSIYRFMPASVPTSVSVSTASATRTLAAVIALRNIDQSAPFAAATVANLVGNTAYPNITSMANAANAFALVFAAAAHDEGTRTYGDVFGDYEEFRSLGGTAGAAYNVTLAAGLVGINGTSFVPAGVGNKLSFSGPTGTDQKSITHQEIILTA